MFTFINSLIFVDCLVAEFELAKTSRSMVAVANEEG